MSVFVVEKEAVNGALVDHHNVPRQGVDELAVDQNTTGLVQNMEELIFFVPMEEEFPACVEGALMAAHVGSCRFLNDLCEHKESPLSAPGKRVCRVVSNQIVSYF